MTATTASTEQTLAIIARFNAAFDTCDADAVMEWMTDDVVFENTSPAPDGTRYEGRAAVHAFWQAFFAANPTARFTVEELFASGDQACQRWRYDWGSGHVRGIDVFHVRDGKVSAKLSYVKG